MKAKSREAESRGNVFFADKNVCATVKRFLVGLVGQTFLSALPALSGVEGERITDVLFSVPIV